MLLGFYVFLSLWQDWLSCKQVFSAWPSLNKKPLIQFNADTDTCKLY
jgi:hypothetical protein